MSNELAGTPERVSSGSSAEGETYSVSFSCSCSRNTFTFEFKKGLNGQIIKVCPLCQAVATVEGDGQSFDVTLAMRQEGD